VQFLDIPGPLGRFCGFWSTFSNAAYSFAGVEAISNAAAETQNPRRNIPKAAKRIFLRILFFYVISVFILTMLVASNDPRLLQSTGTAAQSPFVIAASNAGMKAPFIHRSLTQMAITIGVKVVPHIVNAIVLTSAWSSANSGMLGGSRALYGLAKEGHAPKIFLRVNRFGVPYVGITTLLQRANAVIKTWFFKKCR
jgi:yeast amino acid transporter